MDSGNELQLLQRALEGDQQALGTLLDHHRSYLVILASRELDPLVSARLSGSDIAQQTCLEALRGFEDFRGNSPQEFAAWLNQILANNLVEATRVHLQAQKRSIRKEQRPAGPDASHAGLPYGLSAEQSSPSSRAMRGERAVELANMLQSLPEDQFEAIRLRYIEGWTIALIANRMHRSDVAVAGLLKRGLQSLRDRYALKEAQQRD